MHQISYKIQKWTSRMLLAFLLLSALLMSVTIASGTALAAGSALTVTLTSPTSNGVYGTRRPITLSASVIESVSGATITKVEFYSSANGATATLIGTATTAPYTITWITQQPLTYTLTAKAYDSIGNTATSSPVTIFVAVTDPLPPPVVSLTSPVNGTSFTAPASVVITAAITQPSNYITQVNFYNGSTLLGTATTAPYSFTWNNVSAGTYTLTATAIDSFNFTGTSPAVTITVTASSNFCHVTYTLSSQWSGGFSASILIKNTGSATINGWTLAFTFPGDQKITNLWNGNYTQSGKQVTITSAAWNMTIPPDGTASPGFNGTWTSNNTNPATFTLNGQTCS